ncbi:hypothetical protein [Dactylosporangium sp. CA-233914]|uniref:hypothetical protein n=1 Tax=Dactylosporangium sp. CA-233914 TaxID=3239934 RepID=UPI003D940114
MNASKQTRSRFRLNTPRIAVAVLMFIASFMVAPAASAQDQTVEDLGVPISNYLILDSVLGKDAAGRPTLYGSTYNTPSDGVTFFGVDPVTGKIRTKLVMPGAYGGYHVTLGTNGRVYLGPLNARSKPEIWEYDPKTDKIRIAATAPDGLFCFGMEASPNGKIYCGAYGKGIYEYDPATGALRFVLATETFPKGLLALDDRHLLIAESSPARVLVLDLVTGKTRSILPETYTAKYSFAYNAVRIGKSIYVQLVTPDSKVLRFDARTLAFIDEVPTITGMGFAPYQGNGFIAVGPDPDHAGSSVFYTGRPRHDGYRIDATHTPSTWASGPRVWPIKIGDETWYASVGLTGQVGRWNPDTGELKTYQLSLPGNPTNVTSLAQAPDGRMCGGTYETNALFCYDPKSGNTEVLGNVAPGRSGAIYSMHSAAGKLFMGSYTYNVITVYDPTKAWAPSSSLGGNPYELGSVGDQQYRPWDMTVGPDHRIWVASGAAYGVTRGALTAIDPTTFQVQSFRGLAGDQHFWSVTSAGDRLVAGGSTIGDDTHLPGSAKLLVVKVDGSVETSLVPVPGANQILALATAPDGSVVGTTDNGAWFRFDPATASIIASGQVPFGTTYDLVTGPDGMLYGGSANSIFRFNPADNSFESVASPGVRYYRTMAFDSSGRLYWGNDAGHLLRVKP